MQELLLENIRSHKASLAAAAYIFDILIHVGKL